MRRFIRFFTSTVFGFIACGVFLIVIGQGAVLHSWFPDKITDKAAIHSILKSIGYALLGSGVFTAIIKSSEYATVFSNVIGETIWSKKFIEKRSDKKQMWSMISKILYEEKFPQISDEIEEIITEVYFPTAHDYYLDDYNMTINISSFNPDFYLFNEVVKMTLRPNNLKKVIEYDLKSSIDRPPEAMEDVTENKVDEVFINGNSISAIAETTSSDPKCHNHTLSLQLSGSDYYDIIVKRHKKVCKKTNPDKRMRARNVIKDMEISVIADAGIDLSFYSMGTVKSFVESDTQHNNGVKFASWSYKGLVLPHQGFIILIK